MGLDLKMGDKLYRKMHNYCEKEGLKMNDFIVSCIEDFFKKLKKLNIKDEL